MENDTNIATAEKTIASPNKNRFVFIIIATFIFGVLLTLIVVFLFFKSKHPKEETVSTTAETTTAVSKSSNIEYWSSSSNQYAVIDHKNKTIHVYWKERFGIKDSICWLGSFDTDTIVNGQLVSTPLDYVYRPFMENVDNISFSVTETTIEYKYSDVEQIVFKKERNNAIKEHLEIDQSVVSQFLSDFANKYNAVNDEKISKDDFYDTPTVEFSYMLQLREGCFFKFDFHPTSLSMGVAVSGKKEAEVEENTLKYYYSILHLLFPSLSIEKTKDSIIQVKQNSGYPLNGYLLFYTDLDLDLYSNILGIVVPLDYFKNNRAADFVEVSEESTSEAETVVTEAQTTSTITTQSQTITLGMRNALAKALSYLKIMAFSHSGLVEQLEYEGFSKDEAEYAADNCGADWKQQAAKKARSYLDTMSFSRAGLIEQLLYEGFSQEEAEYGVSAVGY